MDFLRRITSPSKHKRRPEEEEDLAHRRPTKTSRVLVFGGQEESCYSAMESDTEPSLPARLDWRTDPDKSLSDWTIEVVSVASSNDETTQSSHYHVHKSMLILESEYFQSFFGQYPHATTSDEYSPSATRLELHEKAARFFPELLDYMYGKDLKLTSESATVFHFFGHYFGMRRLRWEAKQFWQTDMTHSTVATYYQDAIVFGDPKVMSAVQHACCKDAILLRFKPDSPILQVPDARLWLYLVEHTAPRHSEHLSRLVASFCSEHKVDAETFAQLTAPEHMPVIAFSVTLILLDLERSIIGGSNEDDMAAQLSSLQHRCIKALEYRWSEMEVVKKEFSDFLSQQSPVFLAELFKRTLAAAQASHRSAERKLKSAVVVSPEKQSQQTEDASSDDEDGTDHMHEDDASSGAESNMEEEEEEEGHLPSEIAEKCLVTNEQEEAMPGHGKPPAPADE